jgi:hypothetical protein
MLFMAIVLPGNPERERETERGGQREGGEETERRKILENVISHGEREEEETETPHRSVSFLELKGRCFIRAKLSFESSTNCIGDK